MDAIPLGRRRHLLIDDYYTERLAGEIAPRLHEPLPQPVDPDAPRGHYQTLIRDGDVLRRYYRADFRDHTGDDARFRVKPGFSGEYTAYAESRGGARWLQPSLGFYDCGVPNVMRWNEIGSHNFCPFLDVRPDCPPDERFKALAGTWEEGGLFAYHAADGLRFTPRGDKPVIASEPRWGYAFDSQNSAFYSVAEKRYVVYFRVSRDAEGREWRGIARAVSDDFITWEPGELLPVNREGEHLYVNQIAPYPRAPELYVGTPTRFFEDRGSSTDITLVFSRAGGPLLRPFPGAWIRPGLDPRRWGNRSNYLALNMVETDKGELALYHALSGVRYLLRADGFISLSAGLEGGEWLSRPFRYEGGLPEFNVATAAGGDFAVEVQRADGSVPAGFALDDAILFHGDRLAHKPSWRGDPAWPLREGELFRLRCRLREADLYSFCFAYEDREKK